MNIPRAFLQNAVKSPIINCFSNAEGDLFATAETDGYRIFETSTLLPVDRQDIENGSLAIVLPLHRSDLLILVGGAPCPLYAPNKVILFSLSANHPLASIEFATRVLGVTARSDRLVVVLQNKVVLFTLPNGKTIEREGSYETCDNPRGLACIATELSSTLLCFPGRQSGQVSIVKLPPLSQTTPIDAMSNQNPPFPATSILLAHTSSLSALSITCNGRYIATASVKGTLIRLWDAKSATLVQEFRRGTDTAEIFSLAIHPLAHAIAAASDKGTIHIWDLRDKHLSNAPSFQPSDRRRTTSSISNNSINSEGNLNLLKPYLPKYFSSAWSDAQFRLPPPEPIQPRNLPFLDIFAEEKKEKATTIEDDRVLICWTRDLSEEADKIVLVAVTQSGGWFKIKLTEDEVKRPKGEFQEFGASGKCELLSFRKFAQRDGW